MSTTSRVLAPHLRSKIMTAADAAALIPSGANVGMSGFTGSGYPKLLPLALAERINAPSRPRSEIQGRRLDRRIDRA